MSDYTKCLGRGEFVHVYDLEKCLQAIKVRDEDKTERIKRLEEANKKLKDEAYKDKEIQDMKKQLEKMKKDYHRGFPITEKEFDAIKLWKKKHEEEVHGVRNDVPSYKRGTGGSYSYHFYPTSIGTSGVIRCSCGAEFEFCEIG